MHRDFKKQARVKRSTFTESAKVLRFPSASAFLRPKVAARILFRFPHFPPLIHNNHQLFGPFFAYRYSLFYTSSAAAFLHITYY